MYFQFRLMLLKHFNILNMTEDATSIKLPSDFGQSVLVIDDAFQGIAAVNPFEMNKGT